MSAPLSFVDEVVAARAAPSAGCVVAVCPRAQRTLGRTRSYDDRELAARMQAGDVAAFGTAYETYAGRVYAFALQRLRDPAEAEDLCQDVFVEVARSIRGFAGRSALSTWILGIANHEVANRRRRSYRESMALEVAGEFSLPAREAPIDDRVHSARLLACCCDVLDREIGAAHRRIFQLHVGGARDLASIASTVGRSRQAVKISVFRTRQRLEARVPGLRELVGRR